MWGFGKSRGDSAWNSLWLWSLLIAVWRAPSTFLSDTGSELTVGGSTSGRNRGHSWTLGPPTCFQIQTVFLWLGYFCLLTLCLWNWEIVFVCFLVCMYEEVREKKILLRANATRDYSTCRPDLASSTPFLSFSWWITHLFPATCTL